LEVFLIKYVFKLFTDGFYLRTESKADQFSDSTNNFNTFSFHKYENK